MARPGIGYEQVKQAARRLLDQGQSPSIQRVREVLGTGSNSTIAEHLKRWQQERAEKPEPALAVPDEVLAALEIFWEAAVAQAEAAYQQQRRQAEQTVAEACQARDEARAGRDQARNEALELTRKLETAQAGTKDLQEALLLERERHRQAEAQIAAAEQRADEARRAAEKVRAEAASRVAQLEQWQARNQQDQQQRLAAAEQRLREERERGEAAESRLLRLIDELRRERITERQALAGERKEWQQRHDTLQSRLEVLQQELAAARQALAGAEEHSRLQEGELEQLRAALLLSEQRRQGAARRNASLRGRLQAAENHVRSLQARFRTWRGNQPPSPESPEDPA